MWTSNCFQNLTPDLNLIIKNLLGHILIIILPADLWVFVSQWMQPCLCLYPCYSTGVIAWFSSYGHFVSTLPRFVSLRGV